MNVAIKELKAIRAEDKSEMDQFEAEVDLIAKLRAHPNVGKCRRCHVGTS